MPALPNVPNVIKAGFRFGQSAGEALGKVGMHYAFTGGPPSPADLISIANDFMTSLDTHVKGLTPSSITWQSVDLTDLTTPSSSFGESTHPTFAGTRSGNTPPLSVCVLTLYQLARRYRGGHPRGYWPLGTEADFGTILNWSGSFITAVDAGISALIADALTFTAGSTSLTNLVNVSYFHGSTPFTLPGGRVRNIPTVRASPIVDHLVYERAQSFYASQRKRRGKV